VGLNLLVFFGALYAVRGFGVLAWHFAKHRVAFALAMVLGVLALPLTTLFSVGVGLGDTWLDWRGRKRGPAAPKNG
jgi:cytochrome c oxidase assembly factor CtaG